MKLDSGFKTCVIGALSLLAYCSYKKKVRIKVEIYPHDEIIINIKSSGSSKVGAINQLWILAQQ